MPTTDPSAGDDASSVYGPLSLTELRNHDVPAPETPIKGQPSLPLERLEPDVFERLCAEVVAFHNNNDVHFYGRRGQKQYGLDIVEFGSPTLARSGRSDTRVYQVKRYQTLTPGALSAIIDEYLASRRFDATELIVMTSAPFDHDTELVDALAGLQTKHADDLALQVWGLESMCRRLRTMPTLVHVMFGAAMALEFTGSAGTAPPIPLHRITTPDALERALIAAVKHGYQSEDSIRFEEAELVDHSVNDMFIDVPVLALPDTNAARMLRAINPAGPRDDALEHRFLVTDATVGQNPFVSDSEIEDQWDSPATAGGAQALLHPGWRGSAILIGGPGQGKTTLTQYICQFHRARHLGLEAYRPDEHHLQDVNSTPRIPLRIDLRRYATWRRAKLLAHATQNSAPGRGGRKKRKQALPQINDRQWLATIPPVLAGEVSLESYLAETVSSAAGGQPFTVKDLATVIDRWPTLLVFDGLDEVSPVPDRVAVSDQIRDTHNRLAPRDGDAMDMMMLVATRPGVIERPLWHDPVFSVLELGRLDPALKMSYLSKWASCVRLPPERASRLIGMFEDEHSKPHVAELSSNPMQLAILFDLIDRRSVIPARRTALYDGYIDTFFNREFEKNETMRKHREILVKIHAFLGWRLHQETERGDSDGTISAADVRDLLTTYLDSIGKPASLIEELFPEVKSRVICLVARSQNDERLEFEVQSIREYFAAYWLFKEADERAAGPKDARLAEVIRRPYWGNVARFGAGMLNDGELANVIFVCQDLQASADLKDTAVVRAMSKLLLDDHVFSTARVSVVQQLVRDVLKGPGAILVADGLVQQTPGHFRLTPGAGSVAAITVLLELLLTEHDRTIRQSLARTARGLASALDEHYEAEAETHGSPALYEWWWAHAEQLHVHGIEAGVWIETGADMRVLGEMTVAEEALFCRLLDAAPKASPLSTLARGGRWAPGADLGQRVIADLAHGAGQFRLPPAPIDPMQDDANDLQLGAQEPIDPAGAHGTHPAESDWDEAPDEFDFRGLLISGPLGHAVRASELFRLHVAAGHLRRHLSNDDHGQRIAPSAASVSRRRYRGAGAVLKQVAHDIDTAFALFNGNVCTEGWWDLLGSLEAILGDTWLTRQAALATPLQLLDAEDLTVGAGVQGASEQPAWRKTLIWLSKARSARADASWWAAQCATSGDGGGMPAPDVLVQAAVALCHAPCLTEVSPELEVLVENLTPPEWGLVVAATQAHSIAGGRRVRVGQAMRGKLRPSPRMATILWASGDESTRSEAARFVREGLSGLWGTTLAADKELADVVDFDSSKVDLADLRSARTALPRGRAARWHPVERITLTQARAVLSEPQIWPADVVRRANEKLEARAASRPSLLADHAEKYKWEAVPPLG